MNIRGTGTISLPGVLVLGFDSAQMGFELMLQYHREEIPTTIALRGTRGIFWVRPTQAMVGSQPIKQVKGFNIVLNLTRESL